MFTELTVTSEAEVCSRFGAGRAVIQWESHGAVSVNSSVTYGGFIFPSVVAKLYAHSAMHMSCRGHQIHAVDCGLGKFRTCADATKSAWHGINMPRGRVFLFVLIWVNDFH